MWGVVIMIRLYKNKIFPYLMNRISGKAEIMDYRRHALQNAEGRILEIGIGTGLNLNLYPGSIDKITAVDPFVRALPTSKIKVELYPDVAETMHFEDNSFDTVVSTFTFCSVSNLHITLKEISRVLKPDGKLLFLEHGKAESRFVQKLQNIANPLYNILAFGCNVNRDYKQTIHDAGFIIESYCSYRANMFPKLIVGYLHEGIAINDKSADIVR